LGLAEVREQHGGEGAARVVHVHAPAGADEALQPLSRTASQRRFSAAC
jgi:hypothetical protein